MKMRRYEVVEVATGKSEIVEAERVVIARGVILFRTEEDGEGENEGDTIIRLIASFPSALFRFKEVA